MVCDSRLEHGSVSFNRNEGVLQEWTSTGGPQPSVERGHCVNFFTYIFKFSITAGSNLLRLSLEKPEEMFLRKSLCRFLSNAVAEDQPFGQGTIVS